MSLPKNVIDNGGMVVNLPERIEAVVRKWPHWSRHELSKMDDIVEEILDHCRDGTGNGFVRKWCDHNLKAIFAEASK